MEDFAEGVRALHQRVAQLDSLLQERSVVTDLADRRADAAADLAERNTGRINRLFVAGLLVALLWTPATAYGAVWLHERVRNHCYPGVVYEAGNPPAAEPWYCGAFPGTGRDDGHP